MSTHKYRADRINALSDGIFSIAMTLLMFNLRAPDLLDGADAEQFKAKVLAQTPHLMSWLLSFAILCRLWITHNKLMADTPACSKQFTACNFGLCHCSIGYCGHGPSDTASRREKGKESASGRDPDVECSYAGFRAGVVAALARQWNLGDIPCWRNAFEPYSGIR